MANWLKSVAAAGVMLSATHHPAAATWGVPGPGGHDGLGLPVTIMDGGPVGLSSTVVGMYDPADGQHAHFITAADPFAVYEVKCNSSVYNDTPGGRAHAEAITWWKQVHGTIPERTQVEPTPTPNGTVKGYIWHHAGGDLFLPRPASTNVKFTGGQTVANSGGEMEDPIVPGEEPWKPIEVHGLIFGVGFVPENEGGVLPSTRYNIDWIARAVVRGQMHILGTTCYTIRVR